MIPVPSNVRVWLATGHTDMRKGFAGLSLLVQEVLRRDPLGGHLFCFRGRSGNLLKVIWHDGQGACLFTKRLELGRFLRPSPADGAVTISAALAQSSGNLASDIGRLTVFACGSRRM
jgi:transposase